MEIKKKDGKSGVRTQSFSRRGGGKVGFKCEGLGSGLLKVDVRRFGKK